MKPPSLCVRGHADNVGGAEFVEAVHQGNAHVDFGGLAVWVFCGDAVSGDFQAPLFCLDPASDIVAVPSFPNCTAFFTNVAQDCVSRDCGRAVLTPKPPVLADRDDGCRPMLENSVVAAAGIVSPIRRNRADLLLLRDLIEQGMQCRAVILPAGGELDRPKVGCCRVHRQTDLALLTSVQGAVLAGAPFTDAKELDAGAVHQQGHESVDASIGELDSERLLAAAQRSVVRHGPPSVKNARTMPNARRSGSLNRTVTERHPWIATSENTAGLPILPTVSASQSISGSIRISIDPRRSCAQLYMGQFVAWKRGGCDLLIPVV